MTEEFRPSQRWCEHVWVKTAVDALDSAVVVRCVNCNVLHCNATWPSRSKGDMRVGEMDTEHIVNALGSLDRYRPTLGYMHCALAFELDLRIARGDTVKVPYAQRPRTVMTSRGDFVRAEPQPDEPPRKVRGIMGLKPGDVVNVTTRAGKVDSVRKLQVESVESKVDYEELELRTFAQMVPPEMFTPDGFLNHDAVAERRPDGKWHYGRSFIVASVNRRLAELDKRVKMLEAERGPGLKPSEEVTVLVDHGWDD